MPFHKPPEFVVDIRLALQGTNYKAKAKICMCPFCRNLEKEKDTCGMCDGAGIIIKLLKPAPPLKFTVFDGGKKE